MSIEICLPVYQRVYRMPEMMKQFKEQTYQDFKVNIWNNTKGMHIDCSNFSPKRVSIFGGQGNEGSQARFRLVPKTKGNPIIFIDDDLSLEKDFVEYYYNQYLKYDKNCILGWYSKIWRIEDYHRDIAQLPEGTEVDYIGTGGMILDREIFDKEPLLQNIPSEYAAVEDLYLCAIARMKYGIKMYSIQSKCKMEMDNYNQYKKIREYKQNAFLKLRKEGWELLDKP